MDRNEITEDHFTVNGCVYKRQDYKMKEIILYFVVIWNIILHFDTGMLKFLVKKMIATNITPKSVPHKIYYMIDKLQNFKEVKYRNTEVQNCTKFGFGFGFGTVIIVSFGSLQSHD